MARLPVNVWFSRFEEWVPENKIVGPDISNKESMGGLCSVMSDF